MSYLGLAERLIKDLLQVYTSQPNAQHERATAHRLAAKIEALRSDDIDLGFSSPAFGDAKFNGQASPVLWDFDDEESVSRFPSEDSLITKIIDEIRKWRKRDLFIQSFRSEDPKLNPAKSAQDRFDYYINIANALLEINPDPEPIPKDIADIAQSSPIVNKCLRTLQSLGRLDLDTLHLTADAWPRWCSDGVASLKYVVAVTRQSRVDSITSSKEDNALSALSKVSVAVGIPGISWKMLSRLEHASERRDWKGMCLEKELLRKIRDNLARTDVMSLIWSRFTGTCEACTQISLRAMARGRWHSVKTCVRMLRCAQFNGEQQTYPAVAVESLCTLGAFIFENTTIGMSPMHFIRLEQPPTVSGCLELYLFRNSQDWDGLTKILQTTGFANCENSTVNLDVAATSESEAAKKIKKRRISPISSPTTICLIEEWIRTCDSSHKECTRWAYEAQATRGQPPTLPTRVIDLGIGVGPNVPARLMITNGAKARYAALSYCWGDDPDTFTTTRDNINDMIKEIPQTRLPATFLNAFEISRRLGIRYLWIDALCIIQDDDDDWAVEARNMGAVYQSAHVTIAATCSSQASQPFLPVEDYPRQKYFDLPCDPNRPEAGTFSLVVGSRPDAKTHIKNTRLNSRGWVLQERLLSRRVLHFAKDQIYWECRREAKAEDGSAFPPQYLDKEFLFPLPGWMKKIDIDSLDDYTPQKDEVFQKAWLALLDFYALCEFTRASDRLVALSSLVNKLRPLTKRTYVDGNWFLPGSNTLPQSLFWRPEDSSRSLDPTAPSWSWTSRVGKLDFAFHNRDYVSHVILVSILETHEGRRRSLRLKGQMFTAHIGKAVGRSYDLHRPNEGSSIGSMHLDDIHCTTPSTVDCLRLFDDVADYPIYWALRPVSKVDELPVYERIGIATRPRNTTSALESKEFLLI